MSSVLSDRSKGKKFSFKCPTDLQTFSVCFIKFRASLLLPFAFRCNPFRLRCCELMLSFSIHSDCKGDECLLTLRIAKFAFPLSCRMIGFDGTVQQLGSCFEVFDFSMSISHTICLDVLVVASLAPTCRIK